MAISDAEGPRTTGGSVPTDANLLAAATAGAADAFALLYERHAQSVLALALRMMGNRAAAEDVAQETFLSAWRSGNSYRPEAASVRAWLLGIARHRAIDAHRRRLTRERLWVSDARLTEQRAPNRTEHYVIRADQARLVRAALTSLPAAQRRAIELAFLAGLTHTEIAAALRLPLGTVKGRMRLALAALRAELHDQRTLQR